MINALEDYHTCTVCAKPVHDFGPGADAEYIDGQWFHRSCLGVTATAPLNASLEARALADDALAAAFNHGHENARLQEAGLLSPKGVYQSLSQYRDAEKRARDELLAYIAKIESHAALSAGSATETL